MSLIVSIILAVVAIGAASTAIKLYGRGDMVQAFCAGVIIWVIYYFSTRMATGSAWPGLLFLFIFLFVMLGVSVILMAWWHVEGSNFIEMLPILALTVVVFLTTRTVTAAMADLIHNEFFSSVMNTIPTLVLIGSIGWYLYDLFMYRCRVDRGRERRYE